MKKIFILSVLMCWLGMCLNGQEIQEKINKSKTEIKKINRLYQENEGIKGGDLLPPFSLRDISGGRFYSSEIMYQPAVIVYWSISSQHCLDLLSSLNQLKAKLPSGVPLITIAMEEKEVIQKYVDNNDYQFRILVDGRWHFRKNGWKRLPKTMIVTKENEILDVFTTITNGETQAINDYHQKVITLIKSNLN